MKLIIRNSNGEITEQEITANMEFTPNAGEQYFFTGVENYTFNLTQGDTTLDIHFLDESGDKINIVLNNMAELIQQNDASNPFSIDSTFGVSTNEAGTQAIEDALNNSELENGEIIEALKDALSMDGSTLASGAVIDDFQALLESLEATATGDITGQAFSFYDDRSNDQDVSPAESNNQERPEGEEIAKAVFDRSSGSYGEFSAEKESISDIQYDPTIEIESTLTVDEDGTKTISFIADDKNGDVVTVSAVATNGTVEVVDGEIIYTPDENFNGSDTITVTADDGNGGVITKTIDVTVDPVNDEPTVEVVETVHVSEDGIVSGRINAADVDGDNLTFSTTSDIEGLTLNPDGTYTFDADSYDSLDLGENQVLEIPVTVDDGNGGVAHTTLTIDVAGVNNDISYVSESAGYRNVIGYYELDENGNPTGEAKVIIDDQNGMAGGTHLDDLDPNTEYGFFIIANGANEVDENSVITFDNSGEIPVLLIDGEAPRHHVYHDEPSFNWDGKDHFVFESDGQGGTNINIEDLPHLGDGDFQDVVLNVNFEIVDKIGDDVQAKNDTATTNEDSTITIDVLRNDLDGSGDSLIITDVQNPVMLNGVEVGTAEIVDGKIEFTPNDELDKLSEGEVQNISFNYTVSDGNLGEDTARVTLKVQGTNDAPEIEITDTTATEDIAQIIGNVSDIDGTIESSNLSARNGTVEIDNDGNLVYTPNENFNGTDSISISVTDNNGAVTTQAFVVNVEGVNDGPVATDDISTDIVETITITADNINDTESGFTLSALDAYGNDASISHNQYGFGVSGNASGANAELGYKDGVGSESLSVDFDNDVSSIDVSFGWKNPNEDAQVTFYKDGVEVGSIRHEGGTDRIDSAVTLQPENGESFDQVVFSAPADGNHDYMINSISFENVISGDLTTDEDTALTINSSELLANDTDADGDTLTISSVQDATNGTVSLDSEGNVVFTPDANYNGEANFTYTISDGNGGFDTATVTLNVTAVNDLPTIEVVGQTTVSEDGSTTLSFTTNDIDGDTVIVSGEAPNGTVEVIDGEITYTPDANFNGSDTITLTVGDGDGGVIIKTIDVAVDPVNDAPTIDVVGQTNVAEDGSQTISFTTDDVDGDTVSVNANASNGTVSIENGEITYTPNENFNGDDTITLTVDDGNGGTITKTIDITVDPENDAPTIDVVGQTNVAEDGTKSINFATDDIDGDTVEVNANASNGTVTVENGQITYTPNENFNGSDSISVTIDDGNGGVVTQTIEVTVDPVNDAPTIDVQPSATVNEDGTLTIDAADWSASDIEDGDLTPNIEASNGTVSLDNDGNIVYTPNENYNGSDTITVSVTDSEGVTVTESISVTVNAVNDTISDVTDTDATQNAIDENVEDGTYTGVTLNATDADGDTITYSLPDDVPFKVLDNGQVVTDGSIDFESNESFTFNATATSSDGTQSTTEVTINVNDIQEDTSADELTASIEVGDVTENTSQQIDLGAVQEQGLTDNGDGTYSQTTYEETAKLYKTEEIEVGDAKSIRLDEAPDHGTVEVNIEGEWTEIVLGQEYDADIEVRFTPDQDALSSTRDIGIGTFGDNVGERGFTERVELSDWGDVAEDGKSVTFDDPNSDLSVTTSVIENGSEQNLGTYNSSGNSKGAGIGDQDGSGLSRGEVMKVEFEGEEINQVEFQLDGLGGYFDESHRNATEVKITAYDADGNVIDTQGGFRESGEYDDVYSFTTTVPVASFELTTEGGNGNYVVQNMTLSRTVVDEVTFTAIADDGTELSLTSDINIEAGMGTTSLNSLVPVSDTPMTKEVRVVDEDAMSEKGAIQVDGTWVVETGTEIVDAPMMDVVESLEYPVDIEAALSDRDGSESLTVTITGVPDGGELSIGTDNGDGTWSIDIPAGETSIDIDDITLTVPVETENFELGIEATATEDSTGDTRTVTDSDDVIVPVADDTQADEISLTMNISDAEVSETPVVSDAPENIDYVNNESDSVAGSWNDAEYFLEGTTNSVDVTFKNLKGQNDEEARVELLDNDGNVVDTVVIQGNNGNGHETHTISSEHDFSSIRVTGIDWADNFEVSNVSANVEVTDGFEINSENNWWTNNETINGTEGSDTINIGEGHNKEINAGGGDDTITTPDGAWKGQGHDIDGGEGNDTLVINAVQDNGSVRYDIIENDDGTHTIKSVEYNQWSEWDGGYEVTVDNVENIQFNDGVVNLEGQAVETTTSYEYPVDFSAQLSDTDGSETLSDITVNNLPDGATLTGDNVTDNGDGSFTVGIDENGEANATLESATEISEDDLNDITASVTSTEENGGDTNTATTTANADEEVDDFDLFAMDEDPDLDTLIELESIETPEQEVEDDEDLGNAIILDDLIAMATIENDDSEPEVDEVVVSDEEHIDMAIVDENGVEVDLQTPVESRRSDDDSSDDSEESATVYTPPSEGMGSFESPDVDPMGF